MNYEYDALLESCQKLETISARMTTIKEGKSMTWEQISIALYDILDDIDSASDMAKADDALFRGMVEKLQQKKNQYMHSPDGYDFKRCNEGSVEYARREIELAGLNSKDADYDGMIGEAVLELIETFAKQGHSGFSAMWVLDVFEKLAKWKNLTPLTNEASEWNDVTEYGSKGAPPMWQSQRNPEAFSRDAGKTYYLLSELDEEVSEEAIDDQTGETFTDTYTQMKKEYVNNPDAWPYHTAISRET